MQLQTPPTDAERLAAIVPVEPVPVKGPASAKAKVRLSQKAVEKAKEALEKRKTPEAGLRLGIRGAGCSGFKYVIEFHDGESRSRDYEFDFEGLRVIIDKKSMLYLAGTMLDWEKTLMRTGFKFLNPQEASKCGCGTSFTVKS